MSGIGLAVIGAGYWGPNLVRTATATPAIQLEWLCDLDGERAKAVLGRYTTVRATASYEQVLADPTVAAVAIATPAATHFDLVRAALEAGKHVLVEKPLTSTVSDAVKLAGLAERSGLVLMCDHTYCYTPAVRRIRELIRGGEIGEVQFVDSVRINLGLVQPDVDVLWDLAPHDLSILDFVLPEDVTPVAVAAHTGDPIGNGRACLGYLSVWLSTGALAHVHVNWLSPTKIRTTIFGGSRRTIVWDDMNPAARLMLHDRGVDWVPGSVLAPDDRRQALISYRVGDIQVPALPEREALTSVLAEFASAIAERRAPADRCQRGHTRPRASRGCDAERRRRRYQDSGEYGGRQVISGQRCLVTGGAGTIGSTIVDQLVAAEASEVIVLDNFVRGRRENLAGALGSGKVRVVEGDIRDRRLVTGLMSGLDLVFHQAAIRITQCAEDPRLALEVLVDGTYEVVEAAADAGVRKVIAASSASVYGLAEQFPTSERHHPYANDTLYGAAKTFNEGLLRSFHAMRGLDYVALRYFNVYGPRMDIYGLYTEVLIRWMDRIEAGQSPLILGDGTQTMDFVYTEDIARANVLAAWADATDEVFNIGSGTETSLTELAQAMLRAMGSDLPLEFGPTRGVNAVTRRLADVSAAAERLGWKAEINLDEGLRRLVAWWREQRRAEAER